MEPELESELELELELEPESELELELELEPELELDSFFKEQPHGEKSLAQIALNGISPHIHLSILSL